MNQTEWPTLYQGHIWIWNPLDGMDRAVGEKAMWIAAAKYGAAKAAGKPEAVAHQEAEKAAYEAHFDVGYATSFGNIMMPKMTTKNKSP